MTKRSCDITTEARDARNNENDKNDDVLLRYGAPETSVNHARVLYCRAAIAGKVIATTRPEHTRNGDIIC